jgi:hydroxymethylglutaryl-CoA lyase
MSQNFSWNNLSDSQASKTPIRVVEVGPRDGLQNEKKILSTEVKCAFIEKLIAAGFKDLELTSFVKAPAIPQMADALELYERVSKIHVASLVSLPPSFHVKSWVLIPNVKGLETALSVGVKEIALFSATSDSFTKKNINATVDESFARMKDVVELAKQQSQKITIRAYVSTAYGCPYEGDMAPSKLFSVIERFWKLGVDEISIGDTIGVATPRQVKTSLKQLKRLLSQTQFSNLSMHFHDTRGLALANVYASLEEGIRSFDSSAGGLGGCPYAAGATGNVATEELVYLLEREGFQTGIDLPKLCEASDYIFSHVGRVSMSRINSKIFSVRQ